MRPMVTLQDLMEEAKVRTVSWAICVFAISYFLSHTSKSMWTNIPMSVLILALLRYLSYMVELRWKEQPVNKQTYLSHLAKRQLSVNDYRLSTVPRASRWRRKIDSPSVEAAIENFIGKLLQDFVVDLWYSTITPDQEAPELIRSIILDVLGEISTRIKEINLVDLLTSDMVDLIGNQLELYRKNQSQIGVNILGTLSSEERDEKLKRHMMASKELHPALLSSQYEYKVLQQLVGGVLAIVLRPQEAQCPLVRCFCRELLTCLLLQPVMSFASPGYINELIEYIFLNNKDNSSGVDSDRSNNAASLAHGNPRSTVDPRSDLVFAKTSGEKHLSMDENENSKTLKHVSESDIQPRQADWAMVLEAATKRRSQVLAPENLENLWTKGRNYQRRSADLLKAGLSSGSERSLGVDNINHAGITTKELSPNFNEIITHIDDKYLINLMQGSNTNNPLSAMVKSGSHALQDSAIVKSKEGTSFEDSQGISSNPAKTSMYRLKRSTSTPDIATTFIGRSGETQDISYHKSKEEHGSTTALHSEGVINAPKIRCRVVGAYFEKLGSKSFAVYSIAVTDADNQTWFVKRRYRNFERLHRYLKEIPNYSLHLPPKKFLSSSTDDYLVHQRCILLDRYLQDLLSMANIAEQHEVWDFLSATSKNYSFGKSTSVMRTLAVNVDDAMDDIVRQVKGVSDGFKRKAVAPSASSVASSHLVENRMALSWNEENNKHSSFFIKVETSCNVSDDESHSDDRPSAINTRCHSDNEMNSKGFARVAKHMGESSGLESQRSQPLEKSYRTDVDISKLMFSPDSLEDSAGMPPEWTPSNVSVPLLNLVDKIFQLQRRGWIRRQVFWISKQILQLVMEDAIDDWILRQIHRLRRDDVIAQGISWVQNVLWPNGTFFTRVEGYQGKSEENQFTRTAVGANQIFDTKSGTPSSFELQLEASRRANDVKKLLLGGAPTALVSLIGHNQYRRCARDVYYFLQSTVCVKQLAYAMLELVLGSIFPELRQLISDIHEKAGNQPA